MSAQKAQIKEPLIRMVKRDDITPQKAWVIRAVAFVLSLVTGALLILLLGNNPLAVYASMVTGSSL